MGETDPLVAGTNIDLRFSDDELATRRNNIVSFIQDTVDAASADGAVLGLSGGIDSTLTAYLATEALGSDGLYGLLMPSEVNPSADETDAERVANALDINYRTIEIAPIVETFADAYPEGVDDRMALGNVRVRTRGILNYFVANAENRVVLGTGNRSEAAIGYFTKYGDGAVDCHPIGNLYKCQVRQLAREMGVPEDLVSRTPTAAMWEGQTDEEELGLGYDELDAILALHIHGPFTRDGTQRILDLPVSVIDHVVELHERSEHKRRMPPAPSPL